MPSATPAPATPRLRPPTAPGRPPPVGAPALPRATLTPAGVPPSHARLPTRVVINVPVFGMVPVTTGQAVLVPVPGRYSGISITDNDSPRPTDRIYFHYSYYDGIGSQMNPGLGIITMNWPMIGFEKTCLG